MKEHKESNHSPVGEWLKCNAAANIFAVIIPAFLIAAIFPLDYDYYDFAKQAAFIAALFAICREAIGGSGSKAYWIAAFSVPAILFCPFNDFRFHRETWQVIDAGAALLFIINGYVTNSAQGKAYLRKIALFPLLAAKTILLIPVWIIKDEFTPKPPPREIYPWEIDRLEMQNYHNRRRPSVHPQEPSLTKGETLFYAGAIIILLAATLAIVVCFIL